MAAARKEEVLVERPGAFRTYLRAERAVPVDHVDVAGRQRILVVNPQERAVNARGAAPVAIPAVDAEVAASPVRAVHAMRSERYAVLARDPRLHGYCTVRAPAVYRGRRRPDDAGRRAEVESARALEHKRLVRAEADLPVEDDASLVGSVIVAHRQRHAVGDRQESRVVHHERRHLLGLGKRIRGGEHRHIRRRRVRQRDERGNGIRYHAVRRVVRKEGKRGGFRLLVVRHHARVDDAVHERGRHGDNQLLRVAQR